ncbi:BTB/POZ domain-containing protein [Phthorimaea operculella]|nr:BTB/POZ domain-containing protein [Phthorimaea operculella]
MAPREQGSKDKSQGKIVDGSQETQQQQSMLEDTACVGGGDSSLSHQEAGTTTFKSINSKVTVVFEHQETVMPAKLVGDGDACSWQTKCTSLSARFKELLVQGQWSDCELVGITQEPIQVHRVILASASPVLADLLYNNPSDLIKLHNIDPDAFKLALEFIYTYNIEIPSCDLACKLHKTAHYLIIPQLEEVTAKYLLENVNMQSVILVYEFAKEFHIHEVSEKCLKLMSENTHEILANKEIEDAHVETLRSMFAMQQLNIESEIELFKAAESWLQAQKRKLLKDNEDRVDDAQLKGKDLQAEILAELKTMRSIIRESFGEYQYSLAKTNIRKALQEIRFLAMTPKEFSEYDTTSLLDPTDISAILLNNLSTNTYMLMPKGFSMLRENRCFKKYVVKFTGKALNQTIIISNENLIWKLKLQFYGAYEITRKCKIFLICDSETYNKWSSNVDVVLTLMKTGGDSKWIWKTNYNFSSLYNNEERYEGEEPDCYQFEPDLNWQEIKNDESYIQDKLLSFEVKIRTVQSTLEK